MRTKTFILGGVAIAGLIGVTPALAFTHHPGTPAEHQQTEDLNQQQLTQAQAGTTAQTAAPMGEQSTMAATPAPQTTASATPVDSLANPPQALANASVETSTGQAVGAVQKVIVDAGGKAKTVIVALLGKVNRLVAIAANELTFDESRNVVVAQLSAEQINSLPAAPQS